MALYLNIKIRKEKLTFPDPWGREFLYFVEAKGGIRTMGDTPEEAVIKAIKEFKEKDNLK